LVIAAIASCVRAQDTAPKEPVVRKLVAVKYLQPDQSLRRLLDILGVTVSDRVGDYVAISGQKDAVAAAEEAIRHMDVEKLEPDVEITGWLLVTKSQTAETRPVPAELEGVAKQLRAAFGYGDLQVLTSFVVRTRAGHGGHAGGTTSETGVLHDYGFNLGAVDFIAGASGAHEIQLNRVDFTAGSPVRITADSLDMREGQKVVIGKTSIGTESPLILVLSCRVIAE
jgi:hypothetical protein